MSTEPLRSTLLLTFVDRQAEASFQHFYISYTHSTTYVSNLIVIISGFALCVKAWKNRWDTLAAVCGCVLPVVFAAIALAFLMGNHQRLYYAVRYYFFAFFKVYGATQANYICAALLPNKAMTTWSFLSSSVFLSPLSGLTFYSLGYFLPLSRALPLHLLALAAALPLTNIYCRLATAEAPAARTALLLHRSIDTIADLLWCGIMMPPREPNNDPTQACVHLLDMLCLLLGFISVNLLIFLSELKARVKFATDLAGRRGVWLCGNLITRRQFSSIACYSVLALGQFAGIAWYATGFWSLYKQRATVGPSVSSSPKLPHAHLT